jgi:hypothetical protein
MTRIPNQAVIFLHLRPKSHSNVNTQAKPISSSVIFLQTVCCLWRLHKFAGHVCDRSDVLVLTPVATESSTQHKTLQTAWRVNAVEFQNVSSSRGITKQIYGALCDRQVTNSITNTTTNTANVSKADSIIDGTIVRLPSLHPFRQL